MSPNPVAMQCTCFKDSKMGSAILEIDKTWSKKITFYDKVRKMTC